MRPDWTLIPILIHGAFFSLDFQLSGWYFRSGLLAISCTNQQQVLEFRSSYESYQYAAIISDDGSLPELVRRDPDAVGRFVAEHDEVLPARVKREVN